MPGYKSDSFIFYQSMPGPCPYLEGLEEQKIFTEIGLDEDDKLSLLTKAGFRRSYDILYRPNCVGCKACIPSRIHVERFDLSKKSVRRILNKNKDLHLKIDNDINEDEAYALFQDYQDDRHAEGDMAEMSFEEFHMMFYDRRSHAKKMGFYDHEDRLVALLLYDLLDDGASAIYSLFKPGLEKRSLGKFVLYRLIQALKDENARALYLGYWIKKSPKMAYKGQFDSVEILDPDRGWYLKDQTKNPSGLE